MKIITTIFSLMAAFSGGVQAELYKCSINDQVTYQDHPCSGGKQAKVKAAPKVNPEDARAADIRLYQDRLWINRQAADEQMAQARSRLENATRNLNHRLENLQSTNQQRSAELHAGNCKLMEAGVIRSEKRAMTSRKYEDSQTAQGMRSKFMSLCR